MADTEEIPPKSTGSGLKIVLALSLAMNLAVIGLVAGAFIRHDGWADRNKRPPAMSAFGAPYVLALPRDDRQQIRKAIRSERGSMIPDRQARRAQYAEVLTALRAQPFDAAALAQTVRKQADTTVTVQQLAQAAWLEVVSEMTDVERAAYAATVEDILRRGPNKRK